VTEQIDPTPESAAPEGFATELPEPAPSLWRNRPYVALLGGETVAAVGVEIAQVALPIIAVTYLVATEFEIGVLGMAEGIAFLLLSLPVGALVDRVSRRRVMIIANIVRAIAMAMVTILWFTGILDVPQLMIIALVISAAAVFFDTAYMSIVPGLVTREQLNDANSRLQISSETARAPPARDLEDCSRRRSVPRGCRSRRRSATSSLPSPFGASLRTSPRRESMVRAW